MANVRGLSSIGAVCAALCLAGCTGLALDPDAQAPTMTAAHNAPGEAGLAREEGDRRGTPSPVSLFAVLGEEAEAAAFAAQREALDAPGGGVAVPWQGGSARGTVTPGPMHTINSRVCRDVVHVSERDRVRMRGRSTLCRTAEGAWEALGEPTIASGLTESQPGS